MARKKRTDTAAPRTVADAYLDVLAEEGYRPKLEERDDTSATIAFKAEGTRFLLFVYEDDPAYFRLGAAFELGDGPHDAAFLGRLANEVNDRVKGVKAVVDVEQNGVRFLVETFLSGPRLTGALVERATGAIRTAADDFFAERRPPDHLDA